jgi:hypothetical protein
VIFTSHGKSGENQPDVSVDTIIRVKMPETHCWLAFFVMFPPSGNQVTTLIFVTDRQTVGMMGAPAVN